MATRESLGKVEWEMLQVVAQLQPASVRHVAEHLADSSGQARTTILTTLERLRRKGYLARKKIDGVNHYVPKASVAEMLRGVVGDFVQKMLGGSVSPFVAYLQQAEEVGADELAQLKSLVRDLEARHEPPRRQETR